MVPRSDRTDSIIEPMLTDQWYVAMQELAKRGLGVVANGEIKFIPENWTNVYNQWLENIQDWCISRQLWWGHRIPAWHDEEWQHLRSSQSGRSSTASGEPYSYTR